MIEATGNLWTYPADVRVITTNGFVKVNGEAVMGAGCAKEAAKRWPELPKLLAKHIKEAGNTVYQFPASSGILNLVAFPVKHNWWEPADPALIEKSCQELVALAGMYDHSTIFVIPRPGCGNGRLRWEDVKPILERYLDDRFHVITFGDSDVLSPTEA